MGGATSCAPLFSYLARSCFAGSGFGEVNEICTHIELKMMSGNLYNGVSIAKAIGENTSDI